MNMQQCWSQRSFSCVNQYLISLKAQSIAPLLFQPLPSWQRKLQPREVAGIADRSSLWDLAEKQSRTTLSAPASPALLLDTSAFSADCPPPGRALSLPHPPAWGKFCSLKVFTSILQHCYYCYLLECGMYNSVLGWELTWAQHKNLLKAAACVELCPPRPTELSPMVTTGQSHCLRAPHCFILWRVNETCMLSCTKAAVEMWKIFICSWWLWSLSWV